MCCEGSRQRAPLVERESLAATSLLHQRPREPPAASFDHLVGAQQNGSWNGDANCFGSAHVDNQLETARSLDGQIRGLRIAQKLACHRADRAIRVEKIRRVSSRRVAIRCGTSAWLGARLSPNCCEPDPSRAERPLSRMGLPRTGELPPALANGESLRPPIFSPEC